MKDIQKDRDLKKTEYLLLHGYGESPEVWGNMEGLLKGYQIRPTNLIELFNDPDASRSFEQMASTILKRLTEEGNGSTTIIANSMGGYLALELLRQNPEQFKKLVLIATHPFADSMVKIRERNREIELIGKGKAVLLGQAFTHPHREPVKSNLFAMWQKWSDKALVNALRAMQLRSPQEATMKQSKIPIYFIVGEKDEAIDVKQLEAVIAQAPNATLHKMIGQDHWLLHHWQPQFRETLALCLES